MAGVITREKAEIGVFITFDEPMKHEAGVYKSSDGKQPEYPAHRREAAFKKPPATAENLTLPLGE